MGDSLSKWLPLALSSKAAVLFELNEYDEPVARELSSSVYTRSWSRNAAFCSVAMCSPAHAVDPSAEHFKVESDEKEVGRYASEVSRGMPHGACEAIQYSLQRVLLRDYKTRTVERTDCLIRSAHNQHQPRSRGTSRSARIN